MDSAFAQQRAFRPKPALAAAGVQLALAYALITGLAQDIADKAASRLEVVSIPADPIVEPPPPPPRPEPGDRAEREAAPSGRKADATQIVAPETRIALVPPPVPAAPVAGTGNAVTSGAAAEGPGTGAGSSGSGTGGGGSGSGTGGGGAGRGAERFAGALRDSDYPESAARVRAAGTVFIRFTVDPAGRVGGCVVTRSSGYPDLDALTCRLAERRFRYRPALDAEGRPIAQTIGSSFTWGPRE